MASNNEDTRRPPPGGGGESTTEAHTYRDDAPAETDLTMLLGAYSKQCLTWLQSAELKGKLVLLKLAKTLVCALLLVLTLSSAWILLLATLVVALGNLGVPLVVALALAALLMALSAWTTWRLMVLSLRDSAICDSVSTSLDAYATGYATGDPNKYDKERET